MGKYCEECRKEVETKIVTKKETYEVCGETIEVDARVLVCEECGDESGHGGGVGLFER